MTLTSRTPYIGMVGLLQRGTPHMDGVPGVTQYAIQPSQSFTYRMLLGDQYGFYWYHFHFKTYYNDAIRGPLLIRPSPSRRRPFHNLAANDSQLSALFQAERTATPVLLTDWYHNLSNTMYDQYMETGAFPNCVDSLLANGQVRVQCLPSSILAAGTGLSLHSPGSTGDSMGAGGPMASMSTSSMASSTMGMSSTVTGIAHASSMPVSFMAMTSVYGRNGDGCQSNAHEARSDYVVFHSDERDARDPDADRGARPTGLHATGDVQTQLRH
ncbi:hypothetical protein LTR91_010588 [Friedmanniomyces endolithicus]|uniref:Plastocyanin-like domain-containing protein n=1 Tax=Friedmanniomyces endolithicus TaxID=329885 RepID=A0AAN6F7S1_9PEZI|nr:hypothetical protein LTR35_017247 [Friedmanniomyces endolithicus]KAK0270774.1 hypothetical protein LTS00_016834 [Friedmanniomyces endolithicus]KAK0305043.1 hypothetical protein LTR82_016948 [Friedmanniomyces endolithicus]KAK0901619.1 hypothetical protein LTR57_020065 [Friedmanniomyces endolithicus]KAK0930063.1 hypothetical protein LTR29_016812 [Friedmanniomyces endolithicus]